MDSIGDVSRLLGLTPGTIRRYESDGLVAPRRSRGGHRRYSPEDVERLRAVAYMRQFEELNVAAIRRELGGATPSASDLDALAVGERLRWWRRQTGLSMAELAARTGVPARTLSAVEHARATLSADRLAGVAGALGVSAGVLTGRPEPEVHILRSRERAVVADGSGASVDEVSAPATGIQLRVMRVPPEAEGWDQAAGQQLIYVTKGVVDLWIGLTHLKLAAGDALQVSRAAAIRWRNTAGVTEAVVQWIQVDVPALLGFRQVGPAKASPASRLGFPGDAVLEEGSPQTSRPDGAPEIVVERGRGEIGCR